jgi:hypothetical protein
MIRLLKVFAVLVVSVSLPLALVFAPEPFARWQGAEPLQLEATVEPSPLSVVCAGAAIQVGGAAGTEVGSIERLSAAQIQLHLSDSSALLTVEPADAESVDFGSTVQTNFDLEAPTSLTLNSDLPQSTELFSAWQIQQVEQQRIAGILAASCDQAERVHWFVAGSLGAGDDSLLSVYNPGRVEVAVTLRVHAAGKSQVAEFALAPKQNELLPLSALASGSAEFAVELTASGRVASWLQHRSNRGLSATGVALVGSQRGPANAVTIPSLLVLGSELAPFPELTSPVIRVFNPGPEATEVLVEVVRAAGGFGIAERMVVNPGQVQELVLAGLTDGNYAAFITATDPILAGAFNPVALELNRLDFDWLGSAEAFDDDFVIPVGATPASLVLTNASSEPISATVMQRNQQRTVRLPARSVRVLDLVPGHPVSVSPSSAIFATLQLVDEGYAVVQPRENRNLGSSVMVRVQ